MDGKILSEIDACRRLSRPALEVHYAYDLSGFSFLAVTQELMRGSGSFSHRLAQSAEVLEAIGSPSLAGDQRAYRCGNLAEVVVRYVEDLTYLRRAQAAERLGGAWGKGGKPLFGDLLGQLPGVLPNDVVKEIGRRKGRDRRKIGKDGSLVHLGFQS
jgi:hypothetical protein